MCNCQALLDVYKGTAASYWDCHRFNACKERGATESIRKQTQCINA